MSEQRNRHASMDSIATPDTDKMRNLGDPKFSGSSNNKLADDIFSGEKFHVKGEFDRATKMYSDPTRLEEEEEEDEFITLINNTAKATERTAATGMKKGVKVGEKYVRKGTIIKWCVFFAVLLLIMVFTFPPVFSDNLDTSGADKEKNIFQNMGMTELKTYALSNYSVWNEDAFSSEKSENYRVVKIGFSVTNPTPFEVTVPQYEVTTCDKTYTENICYVTAVNKSGSGEVTGDIIKPFSKKEVIVEMLVNVTGLTDQQFNDAVTGVVISTKGMKKKIARGISIPSIPAFMFVSNALYIDLDN